MNGFEGSFLGNLDRIDPGTALECGICWWVYDPARGDDTWQIPAGTPFAALPGHWRCPCCDAAREQFMVIGNSEERAGAAAPQADRGSRSVVRQRRRELLQAYRAVDSRMRGLPVYNEQLDIRIVGLQAWREHLVGVVVTPWCMNILLLPEDRDGSRLEGTSREVDFPSGSYTFIAGQLEGVGPIESCSLFSPMEQFDDPRVAAEVARHALRELLREPESPALSRRGFLRGGQERRDDPARTG